jgi:hypothetical protein
MDEVVGFAFVFVAKMCILAQLLILHDSKVQRSIITLCSSQDTFCTCISLPLGPDTLLIRLCGWQITVHNKAHLLPDDLLGTAAVPFTKITFGHPTRVSLQGGKHGPSVAGELAFTMEKHGQSHVVGSYDDTGRPLQATGKYLEHIPKSCLLHSCPILNLPLCRISSYAVQQRTLFPILVWCFEVHHHLTSVLTATAPFGMWRILVKFHLRMHVEICIVL